MFMAWVKMMRRMSLEELFVSPEVCLFTHITKYWFFMEKTLLAHGISSYTCGFFVVIFYILKWVYN
jgi:hypothetical protein